MQRTLIQELYQWKASAQRKPLILRGARQVGKTYLVRAFAESFDNFIEVNFERDPEYNNCFVSMRPEAIVESIELLTNQKIEPGKTLLFLDEIQNCPSAIQALRYFKEMLPELHIITAGSLLEFILKSGEISMPVGRVEYLYMGPCSFNEFLLALDQERSVQFLQHYTLGQPINMAVHQQLLKHFQLYSVVGGMPEAIQTYIDSKDLALVQRVQNSILQTYRDDFGKYANHAQHRYLQAIFDRGPSLVGHQVQYNKLDPEARSRDLKYAMTLLEHAGILHKVYATSAVGLPLSDTVNEKKFKLHFLDSGLVQKKTGLSPEVLLREDILTLHSGQLAEQLVGQALIAQHSPYEMPALFFWARDKQGSNAEVDYVTHIETTILPIEVKSGSSGKLKSLHMFLKERQLHQGLKLSAALPEQQGDIIGLPIYLCGEIHRLFA